MRLSNGAKLLPHLLPEGANSPTDSICSYSETHENLTCIEQYARLFQYMLHRTLSYVDIDRKTKNFGETLTRDWKPISDCHSRHQTSNVPPYCDETSYSPFSESETRE
jgi:hypothetical protein